jgi:hypothetical protein
MSKWLANERAGQKDALGTKNSEGMFYTKTRTGKFIPLKEKTSGYRLLLPSLAVGLMIVLLIGSAFL